jgi:hypothetical protein
MSLRVPTDSSLKTYPKFPLRVNYISMLYGPLLVHACLYSGQYKEKYRPLYQWRGL